MELNTWIRNVQRVMGFDQVKAESEYHRIFEVVVDEKKEPETEPLIYNKFKYLSDICSVCGHPFGEHSYHDKPLCPDKELKEWRTTTFVKRGVSK